MCGLDAETDEGKRIDRTCTEAEASTALARTSLSCQAAVASVTRSNASTPAVVTNAQLSTCLLSDTEPGLQPTCTISGALWGATPTQRALNRLTVCSNATVQRVLADMTPACKAALGDGVADAEEDVCGCYLSHDDSEVLPNCKLSRREYPAVIQEERCERTRLVTAARDPAAVSFCADFAATCAGASGGYGDCPMEFATLPGVAGGSAGEGGNSGNTKACRESSLAKAKVARAAGDAAGADALCLEAGPGGGGVCVQASATASGFCATYAAVCSAGEVEVEAGFAFAFDGCCHGPRATSYVAPFEAPKKTHGVFMKGTIIHDQWAEINRPSAWSRQIHRTLLWTTSLGCSDADGPGMLVLQLTD